MRKNQTAAFIPKGLVCREPATALAKLRRFAEGGAGKMHLVFDFDRTLTVSRQHSDKDTVTTWHILNEHLPPDGNERYQELFRHYRALELSGNMDRTLAVEWWSKTLDLFVEYRLDLKAVEQDFLSKASIRPGTKQLFDFCASHEIPTVVLSAGVKDVIDIWMRVYEIRPSVVLSTSLQTDADGRVCGWDKKSLVHVLNKREVGHPELSKIRTERPMALLIGDSPNDTDMTAGNESVFRILIHNPRPDEDENPIDPAGLFDGIITSGGFAPALALVRQTVTNQKAPLSNGAF